MTIQELRDQINEIDRGIVDLYCKRMETAGRIGAWKKENGLPVLDRERERNLLNRVGEMAGEEYENGIRALFNMLISQSRTKQMVMQENSGNVQAQIRRVLDRTPRMFPEKASVACQGVEGAYSQQACERMFRYPSIQYFKSFEDVFTAIEDGRCEYGILPIENSLAGSVKNVYDLMISHHFYIVRSVRIRIDHTLLAVPGASMADIREVYSHEQAIQQCSGYLDRHPEWHVNIAGNTAAAARMVAESGRKDIAAISSGHCAALYGLHPLDTGIQNNENNHTRFICISKEPLIFPGADRTSLMMVLPDQPGALYQLLGRFYAQGINLTKLESRPVPGRDFEFMFYCDIGASVYSPSFCRLMTELHVTMERFSYLGSYSEIV